MDPVHRGANLFGHEGLFVGLRGKIARKVVRVCDELLAQV